MKHALLLCLFLLALAGPALAQHVSWTPALPRVGDAVTIYYDSRIGPIGPGTTTLWLHWGVLDPESGSWSTPPQSIWPAGSRLHTDNVAVQSPMTRAQDSVWSVTIDFDTTVHDIAFVFTDGANTWDNNGNNNWEIHFVEPGIVSWWNPAEPEPGDLLTIYYDAVPGTLPNGATTAILHWGVNEAGHGNWRLPPAPMWPAGSTPQGVALQSPMTALGSGLFQIQIPTLDTIYSVHYVVTDGSNWDNNGNQNWDILLSEPPVPLYTWEIFRYDPRSAFASQIQGNINAVNLAGAFNGWSTSATPLNRVDAYGAHWAEVLMPVGGNEYKFVINGSNWQIDPDNPRNVGGFNNSFIELAVDSLPQIYDVQPGENLTFQAGTPVTVTVKIRPGDLGPGIMGTPTVRINGQNHGANWNAATSELTLNPLPNMNVAYDSVEISATDSAGRVGRRNLGYAFKQVGYAAADVINDYRYDSATTPGRRFDLIRIGMLESDMGETIMMSVRYRDLDEDETLTLLTISSAVDGWDLVPGFGGELRVPDLGAGGVSVLLLNPASSYFDAAIHNRLHPGGDLSIAGPPVTVMFDPGTHQYLVTFSKADLEDYLGSYQSAWYYSCASFQAAGADQGYCQEIGPDLGGIEGEEEPDNFDAMYFYAADVEAKLHRNYGLTRRVTLDAPGRGVGEILPSEIGPNIASPGPLARVLTRGAPTYDTTRTVSGRVTSTVPLAGSWLIHNNTWIPVTLTQDTFAVPVDLVEGPNFFSVRAVDINGDSGRSATMTYTLLVDHAPDIRITTRVEGTQGVLDASLTVDPEQQTVNFVWSADSTNPAPVTLIAPTTSIARFELPDTPGEYYFDLVATDPNSHERRARTFFTITPDSAHGFANNETAAWVQNAMIYEIFVRSYSPAGNLDGVTADLDRIADLGVNCIWLMPIFEGPSDHGYEITDYYTVEQDYGTAQDLRELVDAAHARGIRIILDMVLNHSGIGHPFMQDALRHGRHSHYWDWYDRDANGNYTYYYDWTSLPNLNLNNPDAVRYWIEMSKYWIEEFGIDGYRCDVAWGPHQRSPQFWVQWRQALKEIKPEVLLLAEAGANNFTIFTNRFDQAFDWNLHHEGPASFANMFPQIPNFNSLDDLITNYGVGWPDYKQPLRFIENHDEVRYISENTPAQTKLVASLMMTMPGAVMLYAGQEIGMRSQRGLISWGSDPDQMYGHYYRLTNARKLLPALRVGEFARLTNNQPAAVYSYARYGPGMDPVIFAGDFSPNSHVVTVTLNPALLGLHADSTYVVSELLGGTHVTMLGSQLTSLTTSLSSYQSRVWVVSDSAISVDTPPVRELLPEKITLGAAYPNPFNPSTVLPLELNISTHVVIKIYDLLGREVATLADGVMTAGRHTLHWDGRSSGREVGSGLYFAVLQAGSVHQTRKLILLR